MTLNGMLLLVQNAWNCLKPGSTTSSFSRALKPSSKGTSREPHISSETSLKLRSPLLICSSSSARLSEPQPWALKRMCPVSCMKMVPSKSLLEVSNDDEVSFSKVRTREADNLSRCAHVGHIKGLLIGEVFSPLVRWGQCCWRHVVQEKREVSIEYMRKARDLAQDVRSKNVLAKRRYSRGEV